MDPRPTPEHDNATAGALLRTVRELERELHPNQPEVEVTLDSNFDRQLGFDSLARVELQLRLQNKFSVSLPEQILMSVETPRELLQALANLHPDVQPLREQPPIVPPQDVVEAPSDARTLLDVLQWYAERHGDRPHIYLYGSGNQAETITYQALLDGAASVAAGLMEHGLVPNQTVAIMLATSRDYLFSFFGTLMAGGIPVPIYPPARPSLLEDHLRRHAGILDNAQTSVLISPPQAQAVARLLKSLVPALLHVLTPDELAADAPAARPIVKPGDIALLQYTSGSTGEPKGVILTHDNLLANIRIMGRAIRADSTDVFVSWLPMYHDMGLIGAWLSPLYFAMPVALMSPLAFLAKPQRWLWAIHHHRGTLAAGPNFAYELCWRKIPDSELEGLNLSSWRIAFNGAESVSPQTLRGFIERFQPYGFSPQAMAPVYGLAEAAVGLAFPPLRRRPLTERINRDTFVRSRHAVPDEDDDHPLEFVASGHPLPGYQIRVVDGRGRELPEREEGRVQFQGPSATQGYFRSPDKTRDLIHGDWLDTGDLGYIAGGDIYLTGRVKDMIIRAGRNIYPYEVEEAVGGVDGIRKGCVVVFGCEDSRSGTERIVVLAETRERDKLRLRALREQVAGVASDLIGTPPDDVVLMPPRTVLKTSSGKLRRSACRELYEKGKLEGGTRAVWWQVVRLLAASVKPLWQRARQMATAYGYAAYVWLCFWLLTPLAWLLGVILPTLRLRRAAASACARALLWMARLPVQVRGREQLPEGECVLVCNHASYLDGLVLLAVLHKDFSFVAKGELQGTFIAGLFLRRLATEFVERFDRQKGVADAKRIVERSRGGQPILFFPEGTLTRQPGLLPFYMGAFVAAAEAQLPVVPVTLRGTRSVLRGDETWFPRYAPISVIVGTPLHPEGSDWSAAVRLRDRARAEILRESGEADLAGK